MSIVILTVIAIIVSSGAFIIAYGMVVTILTGAPYITSHPEAIESILALAQCRPGEKVIDLGSGDGRLVEAFARQGAEATGYEIAPYLVLRSRLRLARSGLGGQTRVHWRDLWKADLGQYDIVVVFGIRHIMARLESKIKKELKPGARVLVNCFPLPSLRPNASRGSIFLYRI